MGAVKASLLYCRIPVLRVLRIEYKESAVYCKWRIFVLGSVENLIDGADGVQSLRLDSRKVCNIKRVGISQAESNKATVCALPSIHLPLTREARMWC